MKLVRRISHMALRDSGPVYLSAQPSQRLGAVERVSSYTITAAYTMLHFYVLNSIYYFMNMSKYKTNITRSSDCLLQNDSKRPETGNKNNQENYNTIIVTLRTSGNLGYFI